MTDAVLRKRLWPAPDDRKRRVWQGSEDFFELLPRDFGDLPIGVRDELVSLRPAEVGTHEATSFRRSMRILLIAEGASQQA